MVVKKDVDGATQATFDDGSMWPDGCPRCVNGTRTLPYRWVLGVARYICREGHAWETAWEDLPGDLVGFNLANVRRTA